MNQQSKKLSFNKSTLFSLKAELLKKQEEVKGKKNLPQHRIENYKPPPVAHSTQNDKHESFKEKLKEVDTDELEAQRRSKSALEKKAELYAHLSDGAGASHLAGRFLVDFNTKSREERSRDVAPRESNEEPDPVMEDYDDDDDNEWTDYTDNLGRTRRCLKTDLEFYKKRDKEISKLLEPFVDSEPKNERDFNADVGTTDKQNAEATEKPELVQKTDAYLQSLRAKWEEKERELLGKDRDVHYQDLLFDEARAHGVGYFNFSTEETARRREQAELAHARVQTQRAQEQAAARRAERDALVAARVTAARARQRERMGLPPEEPQVNKDEFQLSSLLDFLTEQKKEAAKKAKEEEDKAREIREEERQKIREQYVREWDEGKDGVGEKKGFREMSQEEYEEQQRSKRIKEFAPPQNSAYNTYENTFDDKGHVVGNSEVLPVKKSWAEVRPNVSAEEQYMDNISSGSTQGLFFSSKDELKNNKYSNFVRPTEPVPIVNELEADGEETPRKFTKRNNQPSVEIEPPPTYEYYGPESKRSRPQKGADIRESYEQGLMFLQDMEKKKSINKNLDYTFKQ